MARIPSFTQIEVIEDVLVPEWARFTNVVADQLGLREVPKDWALNTTFDELDVDSLDQVEIVMFLEEEFEIEIPDEYVASIDSPTLGKLFSMVQGVRDPQTLTFTD